MNKNSPTAFANTIEEALLHSGFTRHKSPGFDRNLALFADVALQFIQSTQPKIWHRFKVLHKNKLKERIITSLTKSLDTNGVLNTLRHGFKCYGKILRIAYFKPAHSLNSDLEARYQGNIFGITRQLNFSPNSKQTLDITLSLNGIPLVTLDINDHATGETFADGIKRYQNDRDPQEQIFNFKQRTLVHFALDKEQVYMTTKLAGADTPFIPFNKGNGERAGNPEIKGELCRIAYLWEEILQPDSFLDLFARFLHLQVKEKIDVRGKKIKTETMIFPRYHQLQTVRELVATSAQEGTGHNYLIEHSAGSGKSNTIAWLAHHLCCLHNEKNERLFEIVIVVTDRLVLDRQIQETIYQFDHRQGVVVKIEGDSRQLAEALESAVPIIITTIQKFPFVTEKLTKIREEKGKDNDQENTLPDRSCAVIIDEAHSSQSGEMSAELKAVLAGQKLTQKELDIGVITPDVTKRTHQSNISFFAFTATPKSETVAMFGRSGKSFCKYSMAQAIEEGFIMNVLKHYLTYKTFYQLLKKTGDNPPIETTQDSTFLNRLRQLQPDNIAQKTEIMLEHFLHFSRHKICGKAKAMVITSSRLDAVRYKQQFDRLINNKNYNIKTLVAFSGTVKDDRLPDKSYTEINMNGAIKQKNLPEEFATQEYQILIVADKYQTGFDQPLLHTMYVDKKLLGIQAVQTLSRLNRIHPLKEDTFILDFVNDLEDIKDAFKDYFEDVVIGGDTAPDRLFPINKRKVSDTDQPSEINDSRFSYSSKSLSRSKKEKKPKNDRVKESGVSTPRLIDMINEKLGENLKESDQVFFNQIVETVLQLDTIVTSAKSNPFNKFQLVFEDILESIFIEKMALNIELFTRYMGDREFKTIVTNYLGKQVYNKVPKTVRYGTSSSKARSRK